MKTLTQIEPRTPISSLPFTITEPGHYYLEKSIVTTGDGIVISTGDVVLDLNGFTLTGDGTAGDYGIEANGDFSRVVIRNGGVRGFGTGIFLTNGVSEVLVEDVSVIDNSGDGLVTTANGISNAKRSVFRRVRASDNGGDGIDLSNGGFLQSTTRHIVDSCEAVNNSGNGISIQSRDNLMIRCVASGNTTDNYSINTFNRMGIIVNPATNGAAIAGSSGGTGTGTTDPFANLSF